MVNLSPDLRTYFNVKKNSQKNPSNKKKEKKKGSQADLRKVIQTY